jgi:hypothetical protein
MRSAVVGGVPITEDDLVVVVVVADDDGVLFIGADGVRSCSAWPHRSSRRNCGRPSGWPPARAFGSSSTSPGTAVVRRPIRISRCGST